MWKIEFGRELTGLIAEDNRCWVAYVNCECWENCKKDDLFLVWRTRAAKDVRASKSSRFERKSGIKSVFFYERKPLTEFDLDGSDQCILCSVNACYIFTKRGRFEIHQLLWQHSVFHNSSFISGKVLRKTLIKLALPSFVRNTQSVLLFAKIPGSESEASLDTGMACCGDILRQRSISHWIPTCFQNKSIAIPSWSIHLTPRQSSFQ